MQSLFRVMSRPVFGDQKCPSCDLMFPSQARPVGGFGRTTLLPEEVRFFGGVYFTERNGTERNGTQGYFTERTSMITQQFNIRIFNTEWIHIE